MSELLERSVVQPESPIIKPLNPIEAILVDFSEDTNEHLPTAEERRSIIMAFQREDPEAAKALATGYQCLVAATAYPAIAPDVNSHDLLSTGSAELLRIAQTHNPHRANGFMVQAITAMNKAFGFFTPEMDTSLIGFPQFRPIDRVLGAIAIAEEDDSLIQQHREAQERKRQELQRLLTPNEYRILSYLHLPEVEIKTLTGLTTGSIQYATLEARKKLGVKTLEGLALAAWERGVQFDLKPLPPSAEFSLRERRVANLLDKRNPEIGAGLGLTQKQVQLTNQSLMAKTGARTRAELALMNRVYCFRLAKNEAQPYPEVLEEYTPYQRQVLRRLHLPVKNIVEELKDIFEEASKASVNNVLKLAEEKTSVTNRISLALELYRRGVRYDIVKPKVPLVKLLDAEEMQIIESIDSSYSKIARSLGLPSDHYVDNKVWKMKVKTGARSRTELALMMKAYDTGKRRDAPHAPRSKLAAKLGLNSLADCDINQLLEHLSPRQRELISAYYLVDEAVLWTDVSARFGIKHKTSAISTAGLGIATLRRELEQKQHKATSPEA